jgi:Icc-related predicted phosphoesterase
MKIKVISDFHMEFWNYNKIPKLMDKIFPETEDDKDTILCCAGDIGVYNWYNSSYKPFFNLMSKRFKYVLVVPGNHSFYQSTVWDDTQEDIWQHKKIPKNVIYMDNDYVIIDDVVFIGSCLWTDFHSNPLAMQYASKNMSDFKIIKRRTSTINGCYGQIIATNRVQPEDTVDRHKKSLEFIEKTLDIFKTFPCVVITHHAPTSLSIASEFIESSLSPAYYSDLGNFIADHTQIKYWFHGHVHDSMSYEIGSTKVICNPFGYYYQKENKKFNPNLVVEI